MDLPELTGHDRCSPRAKVVTSEENGNRDVGQTEDHGTGAVLPPKNDGGISPCNSPSPSLLQTPRETKVRALQKEWPFIQLRQRYRYIDPNSTSDLQCWTTCPGHCNEGTLQIIHWELDIKLDAPKKRLHGSQLSRDFHQWPMDGSGKDTIKITSGYWLPFWPYGLTSNRRAMSIRLHLDNVIAIAFMNRMGGGHTLPPKYGSGA